MSTEALASLSNEIAYIHGNMTTMKAEAAAAYVAAGDLDVAWLVLCGKLAFQALAIGSRNSHRRLQKSSRKHASTLPICAACAPSVSPSRMLIGRRKVAMPVCEKGVIGLVAPPAPRNSTTMA
jgi:hypothetical protein